MSKLLTVLTELNKDEWSSLKKHIGQYTSEVSDVYTIFMMYYNNRKTLDKYESTDYVVEKYFSHLTAKTYLNHMSTLFQWLEEWLVLEEIKREKYTFDLTLLKAFNRRGLYDMADKTDLKLQKQIKDQSTLNIENTYAQAMILHYQHFSYNPIKYERGPAMLKELISNFQKWAHEQLLFYKAELSNWGRIRKYDFSNEITFISNLCAHLDDSSLSLVLKDLNLLLTKNDVAVFEKLCDDLLGGKFENHTKTQSIINLYLIQNANKFWQMGIEVNYLDKITLDLHSFGLENGAFLEHGRMNPITFRNIINTLSSFQSFEDIEAFINKWIHIVIEDSMISTNSICHATNCLNHDKYEKIPLLIRNIEFIDFEEKIVALALNLLASFMDREKEYDLYVTTLNNFETTLKRNKNKISEKQFKGFINLIDFIKKMDHSKIIDLSIYEFLFYRKWCEKILKKRK